jgi:putative transposase
MYLVRRVNLGKTPYLDALAHVAGEVYSKTLVFFWRTVRHQGIWLKPKALMRLISKDSSDLLHAHTVDATIQAFFSALSSWRELRQNDKKARPPHRRKWYFKVEYKSGAIRLKEGILVLSNGRGAAPLSIPWKWSLPKTVVIHWTGAQYEAIATYKTYGPDLHEREDEPDERKPKAECVAGIDPGEIHPAVSYDGQHCHLMNGRYLRSLRQYQNKLIERFNKLISTTKQGSKRRKKLVTAKKKYLKKVKRKIHDVEYKLTSYLVNTLREEGVERLVIGDVRSIRHDLDIGSTNNQKLHQWSFGSIRHKLTYKAEQAGMRVTLQEERYSSRTCPVCGHRRKSTPAGRIFRCVNKRCGWQGHRDAVGAANIRAKYRGEFGSRHVVGDMAPPTGCGYVPQLRVSLAGPSSS